MSDELPQHIEAEVQRILDSEAQRIAAQRARVSDAIYDALCGQMEAKHGGKWVVLSDDDLEQHGKKA